MRNAKTVRGKFKLIDIAARQMTGAKPKPPKQVLMPEVADMTQFMTGYTHPGIEGEPAKQDGGEPGGGAVADGNHKSPAPEAEMSEIISPVPIGGERASCVTNPEPDAGIAKLGKMA